MEVDVTGAPETMPATLCARALDARAQRPVLGGTTAEDVVSRIEYDFRRTGVSASTAAGVALREQLLGVSGGDYRLVHASVTADGWWAEVPA